MRFDMVDSDRIEVRLDEPRIHVHTHSELRIPAMLIDPFEVLDFIFYVLDPHLRTTQRPPAAS